MLTPVDIGVRSVEDSVNVWASGWSSSEGAAIAISNRRLVHRSVDEAWQLPPGGHLGHHDVNIFSQMSSHLQTNQI